MRVTSGNMMSSYLKDIQKNLQNIIFTRKKADNLVLHLFTYHSVHENC